MRLKGGTHMSGEERLAVCSRRLRLEAYYFKGMARPFPEHFHQYYVIGLVESGERRLLCRQQTYTLSPGDMVLFNPGDTHACTQSGGVLDYRGLHIAPEVMDRLAGKRFIQPVVSGKTLSGCFLALHEAVLHEHSAEEELSRLVRELLRECGQAGEETAMKYETEVERACAFMERNCACRISLDQLCRCAGLSRSTLLRAFIREKGITPYRYLENIRVGAAKKLLEQGVPPVEAAVRTGFSDQSHFTNYFTRFIGLSPGAYQTIFTGKRLDNEPEG